MPGKEFDLPLLCNKIALYMFELIPQETLSTLKLELYLILRYLGIGVQGKHPKLRCYE